MLDPYFKSRYPLKHLKKLVYWTLQEHRNLNSAEAVCFTSEEEKRVAGDGFPFAASPRRRPVRNDGPSGDPEALSSVFQGMAAAPGQGLPAVSRPHSPKKGCDLLLEAFARVADRTCSW